MVQMDREVRAREGDMELRTNPKAPFVDDQPSGMPDMRYVSPRSTDADNRQNVPQNIRRDCNGGGCGGADLLTEGTVCKKPQNQHSKATKLIKLDSSKLDKGKAEEPELMRSNSDESKHENVTKPETVHSETSQLSSSPPKATNPKKPGRDLYFSSRDIPLRESNNQAPEGTKSWVKKSDPTPRGSQDGNQKAASASGHELACCSPERIVDDPLAKQSRKAASPFPDQKEKAKEWQFHRQPFAKKTAGDRQTSEQTATDRESVLVGSSKPKISEKNFTTDTHELSYVHDFTDCPVDKIVLDYYEKEEQRSQASQQHALEDCRRTSPSSSHSPNKPQQHTLNDCPEKENSSKAKLFDPQTHNIADDLIEKDKRNKPAATQSHTLAVLAVCAEQDNTTQAAPRRSQPHTLAECHEKDTSKATSACSQPQALMDCGTTENGSNITPFGLQPHPLSDSAHGSVSTSPVQQHALADCHGGGSRQSRRASSDPDSPSDGNAHVKQHRLASCPVPALTLKEDKARITHHLAENARINESGDSQSTVKPSRQHVLGDCMGGAKLERQTAEVNRQPQDERHASLSSLRDLLKVKHDTADHPQKSRYRKEVNNSVDASGVKRTSNAQQSLSQILGGSGTKKEKPRDDTVRSIKGAMQSVSDRIKKRSDSIGDGFKEQTNKVG